MSPSPAIPFADDPDRIADPGLPLSSFQPVPLDEPEENDDNARITSRLVQRFSFQYFSIVICAIILGGITVFEVVFNVEESSILRNNTQAILYRLLALSSEDG